MRSDAYFTGPGWWAMLDRELPKGVIVEEKYGHARVRADIHLPSTLVQRVEQISSQTCELCGAPGKLHTENGWVSCLCERCHNASKEERRAIVTQTIAEYEQSHRATD